MGELASHTILLFCTKVCTKLRFIISFFIYFRDRGETDPDNFVTAYDVGIARNLEGEKEMTAHFERKKHFDNMEYDGKSSRTKQKDGTLKVKSNVTCITDGTFTEYFQPEDGTDQTYGKELHKVVKKYKADQTFVYIGADSTAVNTGLCKSIQILHIFLY